MTARFKDSSRARVRSHVHVAAVALLMSLVASGLATAAEDPVLRWNELAAQNASAGNPIHVRIMAITQLAVFEAVNRITGEYSRTSSRQSWRLQARHWTPPSSRRPTGC